jgi:hypothetical protein
MGVQPFLGRGFLPEEAEHPGVWWMSGLGRLKAGVSLEGARASMSALVKSYNHERYKEEGYAAVLTPLPEAVFGPTRPALLALLGGAAGIVLAHVGVPLLVALSPQDVPRLGEAAVDLPALGFALLAGDRDRAAVWPRAGRQTQETRTQPGANARKLPRRQSPPRSKHPRGQRPHRGRTVLRSGAAGRR